MSSKLPHAPHRTQLYSYKFMVTLDPWRRNALNTKIVHTTRILYQHWMTRLLQNTFHSPRNNETFFDFRKQECAISQHLHLTTTTFGCRINCLVLVHGWPYNVCVLCATSGNFECLRTEVLFEGKFSDFASLLWEHFVFEKCSCFCLGTYSFWLVINKMYLHDQGMNVRLAFYWLGRFDNKRTTLHKVFFI